MCVSACVHVCASVCVWLRYIHVTAFVSIRNKRAHTAGQGKSLGAKQKEANQVYKAKSHLSLFPVVLMMICSCWFWCCCCCCLSFE